jgi:succinoglycan biosynthesis protein ExoO
VTPDVSLVMPVWQPRPDWLRQAVESALAEPAVDVELIVVDDGSPEPVDPLLADVADPRIHVIRIEHAGPYAARNAGIAAARGAFLRFVDSDDVVEPGSTGRLHALATASEGTIAYGATLVCDEALFPKSTATSDVDGDAARACVLGLFTVYHVSILFPRAVVERAGPWDERAFSVSADWDFVMRAVEQGPVRRLDEVVTRYRRHPTSVSRSASVAAGGAAAERVVGGYFARHPEQRGSELERRAYLRIDLDRAAAHAWWGEWRAAVVRYRRALRRDPRAALVAGAHWLAWRLRGVLRRS